MADRGDRIPEALIYGPYVYRLCATADQIADGAVRVRDADLAAQLRADHDVLWGQAQDIRSLDINDL
ncbi:hypothetical protein KGD82_16145 [Nocardiopsis eucommiae]|uniref:Uncharacterized protein n=1 Tax=Nocardiopsis eucommiae TaxID=2831970 RepID=A0A975L6W6_9ACTN|nr:hypothetical protein KGD82_16145 [Nocardiopsis eucommiae]